MPGVAVGVNVLVGVKVSVDVGTSVGVVLGRMTGAVPVAGAGVAVPEGWQPLKKNMDVKRITGKIRKFLSILSFFWLIRGI